MKKKIEQLKKHLVILETGDVVVNYKILASILNLLDSCDNLCKSTSPHSKVLSQEALNKFRYMEKMLDEVSKNIVASNREE